MILTPTSMQQSLIYQEQLHGASINSIGGYLSLLTDIDIESFKHARDLLIMTNDAFRIHIKSDLTSGYFITEKTNYKELEVIDLSINPDSVYWFIDEKFTQAIEVHSSQLFQDLLIIIEKDHYIYYAKAHHVIMDGWGFSLWGQRLIDLYKKIQSGCPESLLEKPYPSFIDCITNQATNDKNGRYLRDKHYWLDKFSTLPDSLFPVPVNNINSSSLNNFLSNNNSKRLSLKFSSDQYSLLECLGSESKTGILPIFLGVLYCYFTQTNDKNEFVVGLPSHNRHSHQLKSIIGLLMNVNAMRFSLGSQLTFWQLIHEITRELKSSYRYRRYPIEHLNRELQLLKHHRHSLYDVSFNYQKFTLPIDLNGHSIEAHYLHNATEQTPLIFTLCEYSGNRDVCLHLDYQANVIDSSEAELMIQRLESLLIQVCTDSSRFLADYDLLIESERLWLLAAGKGQVCDYSKKNNFLELIQIHVQESFDKPALTKGSVTLNYAELNDRSDQLANTLLRHQFSNQTRIGLCFERSIEMIIALLAVMKVGGVFIPLLAGLPKKRLEFMVHHSKLDCILTLSATANYFDHTDVSCICIDDIKENSKQNLCSYTSITKENLAYIIYTSGSTGQPKGVSVSHQSLNNLLLGMQERIDCYHSVCWLSVTSPSFDISILEYLLPLISGGHIILASSSSSNSNTLTNLLTEYPVNFMQATPATWQILTETDWTGAKHLQALCGGETLTDSLASKLLEKVDRLWNCYGPTEATIWSLVTEVTDEPGRNYSAIGGPLVNTEHYILNRHKCVLPRGAVGELYIGGAGVADGYDRLPESTKERFIRNPFNPDSTSKLFKTGDLVSYLPCGKMSFLGRMDDQVKIRGFRIELGEIEAHLVKQDRVKEAVVLARESGENNKYLVAYLVFKCDSAIDEKSTSEHEQIWINEVKAELKQYCPDYMLPSFYLVLEKLPLTPNGKVDRKALPIPDENDLQKETYVAPRNSLEESLCTIWQTVLNVEQVGIHDNFFALGGHSLLATRVISLIRQELEAELSLRTLFASPTISRLSQVFQLSSLEAVLPAITIVDNREQLPLSYAQQRLWFIDQLEGGSPQYNMFGAFKLVGHLKKHAFKQTLKTILKRHEVLRTNFIEEAGEAHQVIQEDVTLPLINMNLSEFGPEQQDRRVAELINTDVNYCFDLKQEVLLRVHLLRLSAKEHVMLFNMHHIVSDGWSLGILIKEFSELYKAYSQGNDNPLADLPVQYADYAHWQRQWLQGDILDKQLCYWKTQLEDIPLVHRLPLDKSRPIEQRFMANCYELAIDKILTQAVYSFCQQHDVTLFMFLQTAFSLLLGRYSNETDIVIGSPIADRYHKDIEPLIGFFVNTLALRTDLSGNPDFKTLLKNNKKMILDAYSNQTIPFEMLVEELKPERRLSHNPVFQISFVLQNNEQGYMNLPDISLVPVDQGSHIIRFDLEFSVVEVDKILNLSWFYNKDLFCNASIKRIAASYIMLIKGIVNDTEQFINSIPLLTTEDHRLLMEWNNTFMDYPKDKCIHVLFEEQAELHPDDTAIVYENQSITYKTLNERSNQLAHYLIEHGVSPDTLIGLYIERSIEMMIAILGILKAGGAYLPLDLDYPLSRIDYMLSDSEITIILSKSSLIKALRRKTLHILTLDDIEFQALLTHYSNNNPDIPSQSNQLAYVIYTSGSTGNPNGVMVEHISVVRLVYGSQFYLNIKTPITGLLAAPISFDAATFEIWVPLLTGGICVCYTKNQMDIEDLNQVIEKNAVNMAWLTAGLFDVWVENEAIVNTSLQTLITGGDVVSSYSVKRLYEKNYHIQLVNGYGPTECVTFSCCYPVIRQFNTEQSIPIGKPVKGTTVYVLSNQMKLLPIGALGELYIGGAGLARGYLKQETLTQEKFIANPFSSSHAGDRIYKTGDLVRWLGDGNLEFVGRTDQQIKIRGFRIELGEIETRLCSFEQVQSAVVLMQGSTSDNRKIVAYILPSQTYLADNSLYQTDEYLDEWATVFDDSYKADDNSVEVDFNITGWNNSYTSEPISDRAMGEWVDGTIHHIRSMQPRKLLEIGSGTGLLLYRYGAHCDEVHAMEISTTALSVMKEELSNRQWNHIHLHHGDALSSEYYRNYNFDTVVINSVIQYFPSCDYLLSVIAEVLSSVAEGGKIFIGDVRNLDLLTSHIAAMEYQHLKESLCTVETFTTRVKRLIRQEEELLISPSFFAQLSTRYPAISRVDIIVKRGVEDNEMLRYRYDVILHKGEHQTDVPLFWFDWVDAPSLKKILATKQYHQFGVSGIPNVRIKEDILLTQRMKHWQPDTLIIQKMQSEQKKRSSNGDNCDAQLEKLLCLAESNGYQAMATWSQDHVEKLDIIFSKNEMPIIQSRFAYKQTYLSNYPKLSVVERQLSQLLKKDLALHLPDYMIPSFFNIMDKLPLTSNGKIDRKALMTVDDDLQSAEYVAPRNETEMILCEIWQNVLKLDQIGIEDNFFTLGGHSLLATRLISLIRQQLKIELPLRILFENPTVLGLAKSLNAHKGEILLPPIESADRSNNLLLSYAQQRLWFIDQLEGGSPQYNILCAFKLVGKLKKRAFKQSLKTIIDRHEVLRTNFKEDEGKAYQSIRSDVNCPLINIDLHEFDDEDQHRHITNLMNADIHYRFKLKQEVLLRVHLLRLSPKVHAVLFNMHHIVSDGWSMGLFIHEFSQLYTAFSQDKENPLSPLPVQYVDYAHWQRRWLEGEILQKQLTYWKAQLLGIPSLHSLPLDKPRPAQQNFKGNLYEQVINDPLTKNIVTFCQQQDVTLFMFLQTAFCLLLSRYSHETDIVIGSPIAGRTHKDIESLIGFFVNTLVLRSDLSGNPDFKTLLKNNKQMILDAYSHQHIPFEMLVEELKPERSLSYSPVFQILFVLQNNEQRHLSLPELNLIPIEQTNQNIKFDLDVSAVEMGETLNLSWSYNTSLFHSSTIKRLANQFECLLCNILEKPEEKIQALSLLTEADKHTLLVAWNDTQVNYPKEQCVHELFEEQAKRSPDNIAIAFDHKQLSYRELNEQSNQLAHYLLEQEFQPDTLIGLCVERSVDMIIGVLGILKAGCSYVPIAMNQPIYRLLQIMWDSSIYCIVGNQQAQTDFNTKMTVTNKTALPTEAVLAMKRQLISTRWVVIDNDQQDLLQHSRSNPDYRSLKHHASQSAYVLYTSGSTGEPKGVNMSHQSLVNWISHLGQHYSQVYHSLKVLQFAEISFDMSFTDIFLALHYGGSLHIIDKAQQQDITLLCKHIVENHIECLNLPSAVVALLAQTVEEHVYQFPSLKILISTAERLKMTSPLRRFLEHHPNCCFANHYGPTETHVVSIYDIDDSNTERSIPSIGRAINNVRLYVVDDCLNLQARGATGQLLVGGDCLARGYVNDPYLNHDKFIQQPFSSDREERLYKTGDVVRYLSNGNLDYLGRVDDQIKIRGFRIELGEIEAQLVKQTRIKEAVVLVRERSNHNQYLVAYLVFDTNDEKLASQEQSWLNEIKDELKLHLPYYMIPSLYLVLEKLPLTPNGKVDREVLPMPSEGDFHKEFYAAPRNSMEEKLASVWKEALKLDQVGIYDNFFELGGHSLLATRLISLIRQEFAMELPLRTLFESPTVSELSQVLQLSTAEPVLPVINVVENRERLPLSFAQQRLWFIDQLEEGSPQYNMPCAFKLVGHLKKRAFKQTLKTILERHEVLRTNFKNKAGEATQVIQTDIALPLISLDLSKLDGNEQYYRVAELIHADMSYAFDLKHEILLRVHLLQISDKEHMVLFNMHHIASDGWSMGILINEFSQLYTAFSQGKDNPLLPLTIQYADYAYWQRQWLKENILDKQMNYWKIQLADIPAAHKLPLDKPRPVEQRFMANCYKQETDKTLTQAIYSFCQQQDVTLFMFLQTVFSLLLGRYSNEADIAIGSPIAGRYHKAIEPLIGFFVNTLVLRTDLSNNPDFETLLKNNKQMNLGAYSNQYIPFEMLVEELNPERNLRHSPVFQISFILLNNEQNQINLPGVSLTPVDLDNQFTRFDMELFVIEEDGILSLSWLYNTDLFYQESISRMAASYIVLLQDIVKDAGQFIQSLLLLTEEQHSLMIKWNNTSIDYPKVQCIHELFEEQVTHYPDNKAVFFEDQSLTYQELNERSNQLAHYLIEQGVKQDTLVGLYVERSIEMLIGVIGILKAGGAYLPLDPSHPRSRINDILNNSTTKIILTQSLLKETLRHDTSYIFNFDDQQFQILLTNYSKNNPHIITQVNHLVYVIYTSGSTGQPKGVMINHLSAHNYLQHACYNYLHDDIVGSVVSSPLIFDATLTSLFTPLCSGKYVRLLPDSDNIFKHLKGYLFSNVNSFLFKLTPSHLNALSYECIGLSNQYSKHVLVIGGEQLTEEVLYSWKQTYLPSSIFINEYGPTEATVGCCTYQLDKEFEFQGRRAIEIGHPIVNIQLYVLNESLCLQPIGTPGELYIGGMGLARGYLYQEALTEEKFIANPFSPLPGERLYKTGDLARWLADGNLEFIGRADHQVTLRGYRIELEEIENKLLTFEQVQSAVAVMQESSSDSRKIIAYILPTQTCLGDISLYRTNESLGEWTTVFDDSYKSIDHNTEVDFNIIGWNNSYTGEAISDQAMHEWVDGTIHHIQSMQPKKLLEIGSGSGLLLYRYGAQCDEVHALDLSTAALAVMKKELSNRQWHHVHLYHGDALSSEHYRNHSFDTVVINSVIQYFPSCNYLLTVIEEILSSVTEGGKILIGDVRNLDLLTPHVAAMEYQQLKDSNCTIASFAAGINRSIRQEKELLISPSFFKQLPARYPDISSVDIIVKRGMENNEMMRYRYDVILHKGGKQAKEVLNWLEWENTELLKNILESKQYDHFGVSGIPNIRIQEDIWLTNGMRYWQADSLITKKMKSKINSHKNSGAKHDIQLESLLNIAERNGFRAIATWSQDHLEHLDILFSQSDLPVIQSRSPYKQTYLSNYPQLSIVEKHLSQSLKKELALQLPEYMIPSAFNIVDKLPLSLNGKIDRKALLTMESYHQKTQYVAPRNDTEEKLCHIWKAILRLDQVGIHDNLFELGGNSIISIQIVSKAKLLGCHFTVRDLFEHQTIATLALVVASNSRIETEQFAIYGEMPLLPIQSSFFALRLAEQHHYNQSVLLQTPLEFTSTHLKAIVIAIYERHDAVRLRFSQTNDGQWLAIHESYNDKMLQASILYYDLSAYSCSVQKERLETLCNETQASFDISNGPLLKAVYFDYGNKRGRLLLVIHHLVVDGVSWRILLSDLELAYQQLQHNQLVQLSTKTSSYQQWGKALQTYAQSDILRIEKNYWLSLLSKPLFPLPGCVNTSIDNDKSQLRNVSLRLSEYETTSILGPSHKAYNTHINELLLSALLKAYQHWSEQSVMCIQLEGHGREELFKDLDVTETVGWFTSLYPLMLEIELNSDIGELIKAVKEQYRQIPHHGIGYGVLKDLTKDPQINYMEDEVYKDSIVFNYLGQFDNTLNNETVFSIAAESSGLDQSQHQQRSELISVNGNSFEGHLSFVFSFDSCRITEQSVKSLLDAYKKALQLVIQHCQSILADGEGLAHESQTTGILSNNYLTHKYVIDTDGQEVLADEVAIIKMNNSSKKYNIFCIHPINGTVSCYANLANGLVDFGTFYGLQMPHLFSDDHMISIELLAKYYISLIRNIQTYGPYYLLGWSLGGILAYEVAYQMKKNGETIAYLGLFDSNPVMHGQQDKEQHKEWFDLIKKFLPDNITIDWDELKKQSPYVAIELITQQAIKESVQHFRDLPQGFIKRFFYYVYHLDHSLRDYSSPVSNIYLDLFKAEKDDEKYSDNIETKKDYGWGELTSGKVTILQADGTHQDMVKPPFVETLLDKLKPRLIMHAEKYSKVISVNKSQELEIQMRKEITLDHEEM